MATVFSNVEADIAEDLISRFPQEFDFDLMLRKVCEDAGVVIVDVPEDGEDKPKKYRLKGLWLAMEKAYKHLVTTLALYGTNLPDVFSEQKQLNIDGSGKEGEDLEDIDGLNDDDTDRDYTPGVRNILQEIFGDGRRQRRPRKSTRQLRKVGELAELSSDENEFDEKPDADPGTSESPKKTEGEENENENEDGDDEKTVNGDENTDVAEDEEPKPRKRGRPRKNTSPFHLPRKSGKGSGKKRGPYKKRRVVIPIASVSPGELPSVRRRGRPRIYAEEGRTEWPCKDCDFVAQKRAKLRSHRLRMHLGSPTKCDLCTKVFPNKRYMLRHRASHVAPQHCCDVCGKMYKIRKAMLEHRKTHDSNYKKTKVKCELCPKAFCNRYILECHIRDIHMGQKKSYLCSTCGKSFTTRHSLAEHTNAHTGVKPHICEVCGKSFSYESALRDHRYTHTDAKHFWCHHCQKGFSQRSGLKMHMRIHRQHKGFICSECGRGFTQKQALQRHERVHKGEKPFVCKHCGRFFTDASIIRRHLILVHKIHKDANNWREDIVCTVKPQNEYQVQKVGEETNVQVSEAEKEKDEILKAVGTQPRTNNKGPSRAFSRTYPRRVALLDEEGNVIAPPEVPPRLPVQRTKSTESNTSTGRAKTLAAPQQANATLLLNDNSSDLDSSSQVLNQRYVEGSQWDALTGQLSRGNPGHIDHIILDDSAQHEIQRGIEHVQGLHKIIKYENLQPPGVVPTSNSHNILSHSQSSQSPSSSPISFSTQPSAHSRALETPFETLNPQAAHTGSQYYDGRSGAHSSAPWSSMFYYSQLASQFGMSINPEYPYVGGGTTTGPPASHLSQYTAHSAASHQANPTALILQSQSHLTHIDSPKPEDHRNHVQAAHTGQPTVINTSALHQNPQDLGRHIATGLKLGSAGNGDALHQTDIMLQQDLQQHSPSHTLADNAHHVTTMDHMGGVLADPQNMMVRQMAVQVSNSSRQSSPSIPSRNTGLHSLKHK